MVVSTLLNLIMKSNRSTQSFDSCQFFGSDIADCVTHMMIQEDSRFYKCQDYLLRHKSSFEDKAYATTLQTNEVDTLCREKMCEWAYRVIDHFQASREIVAISFSYLDRFVDRCRCDRATFKLAAMTAIYITTKVFHAREISPKTLAELSRGEFDPSHILEMEQMILHTLEWRIHPPTVQCFINQFLSLLPFKKGVIIRAIYQRSIFFAEISLFDYCFVTQPNSAIAFACLLNAVEGMESTISYQVHEEMYRSVDSVLGNCYTVEKIQLIRNRLWYIYSQSAQYQEDDAHASPRMSSSEVTLSPSPNEKQELFGGAISPICVSIVSPRQRK
jgi:Cyclin, N-terminal domain